MGAVMKLNREMKTHLGFIWTMFVFVIVYALLQMFIPSLPDLPGGW